MKQRHERAVAIRWAVADTNQHRGKGGVAPNPDYFKGRYDVNGAAS